MSDGNLAKMTEIALDVWLGRAVVVEPPAGRSGLRVRDLRGGVDAEQGSHNAT